MRSNAVDSVPHLRTVGLLTSGTYYLYDEKQNGTQHHAQEQQHEHRHTLAQLQRRHGAVYLRAREKTATAIKLMTGEKIQSELLTALNKDSTQPHTIGTIAPQLLHEISAGIAEANGHFDVNESRSSVFAELGELQFALSGGSLSVERIKVLSLSVIFNDMVLMFVSICLLLQSIISLDVMLIQLVYEAYVQRSPASDSTLSPVRLSLLCEVDNAITAGRDVSYILSMLRQYNNLYNTDPHSRTAVSVKLR